MAASERSIPWRTLLQVTISAVAVILIVRNVDLRETGRLLASARLGYVLGAVLLYVLGQVLSAYRWHLIGVSVGLDVPFLEYVRFYFIGMFFMFFGPSTLGGDFARGLYLATATKRRARAFNSVIFDRLNGLVTLVAVGATAFVLFPQYVLPAPLFYVTVAFGSALFLAWWLAPWLVRLLLPPGHRIRRFIEEDLGPFWTDRRMLLAVTSVSLVFHLFQVFIQWVVTRALGLEVPFSYICVLHPLVSALSAIPISLSGIGLREGGYIYFLTQIGIERASAVAFGSLWFLVLVSSSLLGGVVFLASGASLPSLRDARE
jgi:uncharacterized membrane protein YbhN (UPF0104 family)